LQHVSVGIAGDGAEAARSFYGDLLMLEERPLPEGVDPAAFIWYRAGDGLDVHLHVLSHEDPPPERGHFCLVVGDRLEELRARVESAGIETRDPTAWPGRPCFYCRDPFGNLIELARHAE
jgi:catechol 2,3-dioxygenase-like lactoylglutathione lyase family enzyme